MFYLLFPALYLEQYWSRPNINKDQTSPTLFFPYISIWLIVTIFHASYKAREVKTKGMMLEINNSIDNYFYNMAFPFVHAYILFILLTSFYTRYTDTSRIQHSPRKG